MNLLGRRGNSSYHPQNQMTSRLFLSSCIACLSVLATSCGLFKPEEPAKARAVLYDWTDDGGPGEISVEIDLAEQIATYKRGERVIGWSFVSTGKEGHSTATGNYTITERLPLKHSNRYGWIADARGNVTNGDAKPTTPVPPGEFYHPSPMHYWMRLTNYGVGLHAGEIPRPGEAASHGCIRLPKDFVPKLYEVTKIGTPVKIIRGKPKMGRPGTVG
jgi:lipoprotein-anchoring transpeptidase ErfK/SrfK